MPLLTILVEDSAIIRESLIPALTELADAEVIAVAEGADEAIALLKQHRDRWQLAVVDLYLSQGTGLAVLRACQERKPHQHMVVLTNYATPEIRRRCIDAGADGIYDKSTEVDAFFAQCASYAAASPGTESPS